MRALVDAVVVGAGTVAADNPRLTVREVEGHNPVRVVLDPTGRLECHRHIFEDGEARTLVVAAAPEGTNLSVEGDVVRVPVLVDGVLDPHQILKALRQQGLRRILVEGGGTTVSRFVQAGAVDRLHVTVAPIIIGSGPQGLTLNPIESLDSALRPPCRVFRLGDDVLFDLDFGQPIAPS